MIDNRQIGDLGVAEAIAAVARQAGDDGTGDLGIIVRQARTDNATSTVDEVADVVREARDDAALERLVRS